MHRESAIKKLSDLPTQPHTIGTMSWNRTGDWRYAEPVAINKKAPCSRACPAGVPVPEYLAAIKHGDFRTALAVLLAFNPLPGLTGLLCDHPCQSKCIREKTDGVIPIPEIERFLAGLCLRPEVRHKNNGAKIRILGSGPLELSCGFYLGCLGFEVVVQGSRDKAGGAIIDMFPSEDAAVRVLKKEIDRLVSLAGIRLETGAALEPEDSFETAAKADLVILGSSVPAETASRTPGVFRFNPFYDVDISGGMVALSLPKDIESFEASMIAHSIAAGRLTAEKAAKFLAKKSLSVGEPLQDITETVRNRILSSILFAETGEGPGRSEKLLRITTEANRCSSCGTCDLCLKCAASCPEACIHPAEGKVAVAVDLFYCKGCGLCAYECPRGIIKMEDKSL